MSLLKKRATETNVLIEERSYRNKLTIPSMIRLDHHLWSDDATIGSKRIFVGVVDKLVAGLGNGVYKTPRNVKVTTVVINIMLMTMMIKTIPHQAIKLGLMLIKSSRGESLRAALALHTFLVIRFPVIINVTSILFIVINTLRDMVSWNQNHCLNFYIIVIIIGNLSEAMIASAG